VWLDIFLFSVWHISSSSYQSLIAAFPRPAPQNRHTEMSPLKEYTAKALKSLSTLPNFEALFIWAIWFLTLLVHFWGIYRHAIWHWDLKLYKNISIEENEGSGRLMKFFAWFNSLCTLDHHENDWFGCNKFERVMKKKNIFRFTANHEYLPSRKNESIVL
jgi:hypothetical protein